MRMTKPFAPLTFLGLLLSMLPLSAFSAEPPPDAGLMMNQIERNQPQRLQPQEPPTQDRPEKQPVAPLVKVLVKGFRIQGATLFKEEELQKSLERYIDKEMTYAELQKAANSISALYLQQKDLLAKANALTQNIKDGIVTIIVKEFKMGDVQVDKPEGSRLDDEVAKKHLMEGQVPGNPLNMKLEKRAMLLLNDMPGVAAQRQLKPGKKPGEINILVKLKDKPLFSGSAGIDSNGARTTGVWMGNTQLMANNWLGIGDQTQITFRKNYSSASGRAEFSLPIGHSGLRASLFMTGMEYEIPEQRIHGHSINVGTQLNYPIIRSSNLNLRSIGGYTRKFMQTYNGTAEVGDKFVDVGTIGLTGNMVDRLVGLESSTQGSVTLFGGRVAYGGNRDVQERDKRRANADGNYSKFSYSINRSHKLTESTSFWMSFNGQFAFKNLDSSEKLLLGGTNGVRAYSVSEGVGDEGWIFNAELRHDLFEKLQGAVFFDHGSIKVNHETFPRAGVNFNQYALQGVGGYLNLSDPGNYSLRLTIATPLASNPGRDRRTGDDADGRQADPRFWLIASKQF